MATHGRARPRHARSVCCSRSVLSDSAAPICSSSACRCSASAVWSIASKPRQAPAYRCTLDHAILREGEATTWRASADEGDGIDRLALSLGTDPASRLSPTRGALIVAASDDGHAAEASIVITSVRWGRRDVGTAAVATYGAWAAFRSGPLALQPGMLTTLPLPAVFDNRASVPNPQGIVGSHHSRAAGRRRRVRHDPPVRGRRPAAAHPLAGLAAHR